MKALLFDFDGTLIDSAPDIADALNDTLASLGRPAVGEAQVRAWIGDGGRALLGKAIDDPALAESAWPTFTAAYEALCGQRGGVHEGVRPMLQRLRDEGVKLALLTNKESRFTHRLLQRYQLMPAFDAIVAGDSLPVKKPDPAVVHHALRLLGGIAPQESCLIGDSVTDVRCARAAGIAVRLVRHGYPGGALEGSDAPDAFVDHFDELVAWAAQACMASGR